MNGFIEIYPGIWYEESTGLPWSSRRFLGRGNGWTTDGKLKRLTCKNSNGYYTVVINGKMKYLHRLVYEHFNGPIPTGLQVDHMNNVITDNRISNLQLLSHKDNSRCRLKQKNNTSGVAGVYWHKQHKKWRAQIKINGKLKYLGLFEQLEAAHQAYLQAKIKYHGIDSIRAL